MKRLCAALWALVLTTTVLLATATHAQSAAPAANSPTPLTYHLSDEVTLVGTVSSVLTEHAPGTIMGSHLLVQTPFGIVDASLGRFGFTGKGAIRAKSGEQVELTGVMKTIANKPVFLTRIVKIDGQIYSVRNMRGFPMSPQARDGARQKTAQKGESL